MISHRKILVVASLLTCFWPVQADASVETAWTTTTGKTTLYFFPENLAAKGLSLELDAVKFSASGLQQIEFDLDRSSSLSFTENDGHLSGFSGGRISHGGNLVIRSLATSQSVSIEGFQLDIDADSQPRSFLPKISPRGEQEPLLTVLAAKAGLYRDRDQLWIEGADIRISLDLAKALGNAHLAGVSIGDFRTKADIDWAGGAAPVPYEDLLPPGDSGDPRGGNNGTDCPTPVGPDVITGEITDIGNYGTSEIPPGSGNFIAAFAVGTDSCNVGNELVLWDDDQPPPTNLHPVIAQNFFRLRTMPDGSTRFEQIGQSWLKHAFTVAASDTCGCGCTGPGGPQMHPGCSDAYFSGLNGAQGSLGPRWQVNARTGEYPHPYQNGVNTPGDANQWKRLQVRTTDFGTPNSLYFADGHYITQDDQQEGNASNNTSYIRLNVTGGGTNWNAQNAGPTIRMQAPIRAWKAAVPSVVETDIRIAPTAGEPHQNADDYFILAANVKDLNDGTWAYEYALYNMHSHRGARSFSVPVPNSADVSGVEFHDVNYHSGDGNNGVTRNGTDWQWTREEGALTWQTSTFAQNPNANALLWGTLYNFRFVCDVAPAGENADVTVGLFRPGAPNAAISSVNALTVIPEPFILDFQFVGGAPITVMLACTDATFDVDVLDGADTYQPGTATLHYSVNDEPYTDVLLSHVSGTTHRGTIPALECDATLEFYLSAQSEGGETVTLPEEAPTAAVFAPEVGMEEVVDVIGEDFEAGLSPEWSAAGLWHATGSCPVVPACGSGNGSQWAYFGDSATCNYDTGSASNHSLTRTVAIPSTRLATLKYCSNFQREAFGTADWPTVKVNSTIVDRPALGGLGSSPWVERTVDLTPYAGQTVTLEWNFNTVDSGGNNFRGWQIDNVRLETIQVLCRATSPVVAGDVDGDGVVDGRDIEVFTAAVLNTSLLPEHVCPADFSSDGRLDVGDLEGMVDALLAQP
ncbi:MAG TPA: hypothetical protein VNT79_04650 [Phycisphaerae bacterium]|nr:hypothetical protein [Phycisphaerae bacterium]